MLDHGRGMRPLSRHPVSAVHLRVVAPPSASAPDEEDWALLLDGARAGRARDELRLVTLVTPLIERILLRTIGPRPEVEDLSQEVLIRVFERLDLVREASALRGFVASVAVFVARESIRARRRRKWLFFLPPEELPEIPLPGFEPAAREALRAFYATLDRLPTDERIALCLRHVEQMEILEICAATGWSSSTVKRRLNAGETRFLKLARHRGELDWLWTEEAKWPAKTR